MDINIINRLLPEDLPTVEEIESRYSSRSLPEGARVTRVAPSPTGFFHIGVLYAALISERMAHQSGGVFYIRIEDTDKKREVAGTEQLVYDTIENYGLKVDEMEGRGEYGPYVQSKRKLIYQSYVKKLLQEGLAYPCFLTGEEIEDIRKTQEQKKLVPGIYGQWAVWRDKSEQEIINMLEKGKEYVIRLKSTGDAHKKIKLDDVLRGEVEFPEYMLDVVLLKSDGLPTYHFAHIIDDHLMGTTHVIRGDEWLSSAPLHMQLFRLMGWRAPKYGHISPIQKMDGTSRRKLSKRKDPEANIEFYSKMGYPKNAVLEYLLNLANSGFEDWRKRNPVSSLWDYPLSVSGIKKSAGALLDMNKLNDISSNILAAYDSDKIYKELIEWAKAFDPDILATLSEDEYYSKRVLSIERDTSKPRKDMEYLAEVKESVGYFFDNWYTKPELGDEDKTICREMKAVYLETDEREIWSTKLNQICTKLGYATSKKEYELNIDKYSGHIGDVAKALRMALCGKNESPDLWEVMRVMGQKRVVSRLEY